MLTRSQRSGAYIVTGRRGDAAARARACARHAIARRRGVDEQSSGGMAMPPRILLDFNDNDDDDTVAADSSVQF